MHIETIIVSPFETNCYLVYEDGRNSCVIVDPGDEDDLIQDRAGELGIVPKAILLTHGHADHIAAVKPIKEKLNIPIYIGRGDEGMLESPTENVSVYFGYKITCPPADFIVRDGEVITIDSMRFTVFATPGHSRGGVCYFADKFLLCGDTLFYGSIGRTDLPGGNYQLLLDSIDRSILTLPDDIICYPGHGPATTVGEERRNNPFITGRRFV